MPGAGLASTQVSIQLLNFCSSKQQAASTTLSTLPKCSMSAAGILQVVDSKTARQLQV
jgi:hypothetical protein